MAKGAALPTELQPSCRPESPGTTDDDRCLRESRLFLSAPHAAGGLGSPVRMHRCQTAFDGRRMKNAPPAWCAGGASGRSLGGRRASARARPILRVYVLSAADTRVGRPCYRYEVASFGSSIRLDCRQSPRRSRSSSPTLVGGLWTQRRPGRRYLAASRSLVF